MLSVSKSMRLPGKRVDFDTKSTKSSSTLLKTVGPGCRCRESCVSSRGGGAISALFPHTSDSAMAEQRLCVVCSSKLLFVVDVGR